MLTATQPSLLCNMNSQLRSLIKVLLLAAATLLVASCAVQTGDKPLVLIPNPIEPKRTGQICVDSPVEAYLERIDCKNSSVTTVDMANSKVSSTHGGCALEAAILHERPDVFEEFLSKGGDLRSCTGYPLRIFGAVASVCRDKPDVAHRLFETISKTGAFHDRPQILLYKSAQLRCVEGVRIALAHGAKPNIPAGQKATDDWADPASSLLPLETATIYGTRGYPEPMIEIIRLLIAAGASPLTIDAHGDTLLKRAEKDLGGAPYWPRVKAALLSESLSAAGNPSAAQ